MMIHAIRLFISSHSFNTEAYAVSQEINSLTDLSVLPLKFEVIPLFIAFHSSVASRDYSRMQYAAVLSLILSPHATCESNFSKIHPAVSLREIESAQIQPRMHFCSVFQSIGIFLIKIIRSRYNSVVLITMSLLFIPPSKEPAHSER